MAGRSKKPGSEERSRFRRGSLGLWTTIAILLLIAGYVALLEVSRPHVGGQELRFDEFVDLVERGRIADSVILDEDSYVLGSYKLADGTTAEYNVSYLQSPNPRERLIDLLVANRVPITIDQQFTKSLVLPASIFIPTLIVVLVFVYFIVSYRRGTGLFEIDSGARKAMPDDTPVSFSDVAGQETAVAELREVSRYLSDPKRFEAVGAQIPKGILLYGPPGCGKTLIARALAGEAGAAFYSISGADFVELYVGVGASRARELFREARANAPAIVFIDELDSVGQRRAAGGSVATGSRQEQEQALNQILAEMDGFSPSEGVIVVGATNRPDVLDQALLRPGRFDRAIALERPDEQARRGILAVHARGRPLAGDVDLDTIARGAVGLTGADLANVINEASLEVARAGRETIAQADLATALTRVQEAPERQRRLSVRDRTVGRTTLADEEVGFDDVAGVDDAIAELAEVRDFLADPERFEQLGARIPGGYLLSGPPGCGKTLLARAVASEANATFVSASATEFVEVYVGEGAARVRDLFAEARGAAPAIVFIDEIDAIGKHRGAELSGGGREFEQTLNQILVELDGFNPRAAVVVMAATNRPDILDPALVRPGRFDRSIEIDLPDRAARIAILEVHARNKRLADDVELDKIASLTRGLSGADLEGVLNEAALLSARNGLTEIPMQWVEEGVDRVTMGIAAGHVLSDEERRRVAYHEAGHAVVGSRLPGARPPRWLSIISRGRTLGYVRSAEESDRYVRSRSELIDEMAMLLGGMAADVLVFGEAASGGASDLARVRDLARWMVCELGMSELGALAYSGPSANGQASQHSEETARRIDAAVQGLATEAEGRAREVIEGARDELDRIAAALIERERLSAEDLDELLGRADAPV